jgi:eukaryotic-like serine/threonine-protein kinase
MKTGAPEMSPDSWSRRKELFWQALEQGAKWREFLERLCGNDEVEFRELEALVQEHFRLDSERTPTLPSVADPRHLKQSVPARIEDRFAVDRKIGSGTFGDVYKVYDETNYKDVALKILRDQQSEAIRRFKNEWRTLRDFQHPNIVKLYDLIEGASQWMFTMELVEGMDFLKYVQRDHRDGPLHAAVSEPKCSDARLRNALLQLATGLSALHSRELIHRDLKPSNVLVSNSGRVVLLDFGLVRHSVPSGEKTFTLAGTLEYMSPEQVDDINPSYASDWYSVGVMLYQALTGKLPFEGSILGVLQRKRTNDPPPPRELAAGVAEDLSELCMGLLSRKPEKRLGYADVMERLLQHQEAERSKPWTAVVGPVFVGREEELTKLESAYSTVSAGNPVTVHIRGPSGIGKTVLIREFLARVRTKDPDALIFAGRCYESESVRFKGLDDLVDRLSQHLYRLPAERVEQVLPRNFALLARMFPVLRQLGEARVSAVPALSSAESRNRAFTALTEMLGRLAERNRVVLVIDDLQWSDLDGAEFFRNLMASSEAPPLLLILAYRSEDINAMPWLRSFAQGANVIALDRLSRNDAVQLACSLTPGGVHSDESRLRFIADQTEGDPFLINQLVGWMAKTQFDVASLNDNLRIEEVINVRINSLTDDERHLLELVAIAGQPTAVSIFESILGRSKMFDAQDTLVNARLLRSRRTQGGQEVEVYHDRIRAAVIQNLTPATLRRRHQEIANAFALLGGADPERLWFHYHHAGEHQQASTSALTAADQAVSALAFNKAAMLYDAALNSPSWDTEKRRNIRRSLADALGNIGRGRDAADTYLAAAEGASSRERAELERFAALQLLRSGYVERGIALLEDLLRKADLQLTRVRTLVLCRIVFLRALIRLRGFHFQIRRPGEIPDHKMLRVDLCGTAAMGLGMIDPFRAAVFSLRYTLMALRLGEVYRLSLALAQEAVHLCHTSRSAKLNEARSLLTQAAGLADGVENLHAKGFVKVMSASIFYLQGNWKAAAEEGDAAVEILSSNCPGVAFELTTAHIFAFLGRNATGQWKENRKRLAPLINEATARADLYGTHSFRLLSCTYILDLARDDPEGALRQMREDIEAWPYGEYSVQKCGALQAEVDIALYRRTPWEAWDKMEREWPLLVRSQLLRQRPTFAFTHFARARLALAMASESLPNSKDQRQFLQVAARDAARLERQGPRWSQGLVAMVRSGLATFDSDVTSVRNRLIEAARLLEQADLMPFLSAVLYRQAAIERKRLDDRPLQWFNSEAISKPDKVVAALTPGMWSKF